MNNSLKAKSEEFKSMLQKMKVDTAAELKQVEDDIATISNILATTAELKTDLSENASAQLYKDQRDMKNHVANLLRNRLEDLEDYDTAYKSTGYVILGSTVEIQLLTINGVPPTFTPNTFVINICKHAIGNAKLGFVAIDSEVGKKLLDHKVGDIVAVVTRKGELNYKIERIY